MKKRTLSIILVLCLVMSMFFSIPVFAAGSITLDKTECKPGEAINITVQGLTQEEIDDNANIAYAKDGERYENFEVIDYVMYLPRTNVYDKFKAPMEFGCYEIALLDGDMNFIDSVKLNVVPPRAKEGDIKIDKTEAKIQEEVAVTINGLTKEMIDDNAFVAICDVNLKNENSMLDNESIEYIMYLPRDNTYRFKAPNDFGLYEARVFSAGLVHNNEKEANEKLFGKVSFRVVSSKAKAGDIVLSNTIVRPGEKLSVTVNGLSKGEISNGAWLGVVKSGEKLANTPYGTSIESLPVNNTYEFTSDIEPGKYEVRVFCFRETNKEEAYYEYGMFGKAEFLVSGDAAPSDEYVSGYEGLHSWHVEEINTAKKENLVTDKVLSEFPKDITREEFCELAVLLYEKMTGTKAVAAANPFTDTNNPEILKAYNLNIVGGVGDGKFAPNNNVTRQEISAMLVRTLKAVMPNIDTKAEFKTKFQDERDIAAWALENVKFMNANDIIKGTEVNSISYILPKGNTTREQAIALVLRIYNKFYKL